MARILKNGKRHARLFNVDGTFISYYMSWRDVLFGRLSFRAAQINPICSLIFMFRPTWFVDV
jgi:hypothetical protein